MQQIARAIRETETGGNFDARGSSGERGAYQFLPDTFALWSTEVAGRVLPFTRGNEEYVALGMIKKWVLAGYSDNDIVLFWNQGHPGACARGHNRHGVFYDSCAYARKVLALLPQ